MKIAFKVTLIFWLALLSVLFIGTIYFLINLDPALPNIQLDDTGFSISPDPMPPEREELIEKVLLVIVVSLLNFVLVKIGRKGYVIIKKGFFRTEYDYQFAANALAGEIATKIVITDLADALVKRLAKLMKLRIAGALFFNGDKLGYARLSDDDRDASWREYCLKNETAIYKGLQLFRSESRISVDYLRSEIKDAFTRVGLRVVFLMRIKGDLAGAIVIGEKQSGLPMTGDDFSFLSSIAQQAAVAIERARLYDDLAEQERISFELEIARNIQRLSLPQHTPQVAGLDLAGISVPSTEVGGDYFDYLNGAIDKFTVVIADVSGKGISAAFYMSKMQGILRSVHEFQLSPREIFLRANKLLCTELEEHSFVTALAVGFDLARRCAVLVRAGHLPLYHYRMQDKSVAELTPSGLGLGLAESRIFDAELVEVEISYEAGDIFLFVTDGVTEARNGSQEEFGEARLVEVLKNSSALTAQEIRDHVMSTVDDFAARIHHDDQTVVVVKAT